jgi:sodium/potassium/calcium exchanger 6
MFVTTVVVGAVSLSVSYDLNQRPYLRDVVFYLGALAWTVIIVYRKKIDLLQAIGIYVVVVVVVVESIIRQLRMTGIGILEVEETCRVHT